NLRTAGCANRSVGSDTGAVLAADAFGDAELLKIQESEILSLDIFDLRERRRLGLQPSKKLRNGNRISCGSDQHSKAVIKNLADQSLVTGQTPYGRPKANALNGPSYTDFDGLPNLHRT